MKDCAPKAARSLVVSGGMQRAAPAHAATSGTSNDFDGRSFDLQNQD